MIRYKYNEHSILNNLKRNPGIQLDLNTNNPNVKGIIKVKYGHPKVGNGTLGKIDFLTKYCNYIVIKD